MEQYFSISREVVGKPIYAFDKLDGSNIRAEWGRKKGKWGEFWKFGTKTQLLDETNKEFGEAIQLVKNKYEEALTEKFRKQQWEKTTCFFEFWGPNSFAGTHASEPHDVTLFDIKVFKKGFLLPRDYLKLVDGLDVAKLLYFGNPNEDFIRSVQEGTLQGMTFEGVVCKANEFETPGIPWYFKVKNRAWVSKLKEKCKGNENLFQTLV
jgi:hypothetical protein